MPAFQSSRKVPFSAEQMFDLVADVERYPEFVPLCASLRIKKRTLDGQGGEVLVADMGVAYKLIRESFTSRVTLAADKSKILVEYVDGPFSRLENTWTFTPDGDGASTVGFAIAYEFRSRILAAVMGAAFDAAFRRFADAFEKRAHALYDRR